MNNATNPTPRNKEVPEDTIWLNLVLSSLNSAAYFVVYKLYCIISLVKLSYKPLQGLQVPTSNANFLCGCMVYLPLLKI